MKTEKELDLTEEIDLLHPDVRQQEAQSVKIMWLFL